MVRNKQSQRPEAKTLMLGRVQVAAGRNQGCPLARRACRFARQIGHLVYLAVRERRCIVFVRVGGGQGPSASENCPVEFGGNTKMLQHDR
jgi:hypothetical protein